MKILNRPIVSIIVPVYNVEKYLRKCVESLRSQTMKDLEIILINDGSTDGSLKVCQQLVQSDYRIRLLDQRNEGVSAARNAGMRIARGDYVGFVDPDDWVSPDMYQGMYDRMIETGATVCVCDYIIVSAEATYPVRLSASKPILKERDIVEQVVAKIVAPFSLDGGPRTNIGSACRLLIKTSFLNERALRFPLGISYMEDLVFSVQLFLQCEKVVYEPKEHYYYLKREGSATDSSWRDLENLLTSGYEELKRIITLHSNSPVLTQCLDLRYASHKIRIIRNEVRKPHKSRSERIRKIRSLCRDQKLKTILSEVNTRGYGTRRRILLWAVEKEYVLFIYISLSLLPKVLNRKK